MRSHLAFHRFHIERKQLLRMFELLLRFFPVAFTHGDSAQHDVRLAYLVAIALLVLARKRNRFGQVLLRKVILFFLVRIATKEEPGIR